MAAALYSPRNDTGPNAHSSIFPHSLMTTLDFHDNRYPSLTRSQGPPNSALSGPSSSEGRRPWMASMDGSDATVSDRRPTDNSGSSALISGWSDLPARASSSLTDRQSRQPSPEQEQERKDSISYPFSGPSLGVDDSSSLRPPSRTTEDPRITTIDSFTQDSATMSRSNTPQPLVLAQNSPRDLFSSTMTSAPRHPALPVAGVGSSTPKFPANIIPLSASPAFNPPISPRHRAYAQQPTYITPQNAVNPVNPVYPPQQQEEVCIECSMRDQDMADVDVTSPGVWSRESDAGFAELKRREEEENAIGAPNDPQRPRVSGGRLTEENLKIWLSLNPREPASRQQTLQNYLKSQRAMLKAESLAYTQAMQEAKQLDNKMRDTYSQLRRSAYDTGNSATPIDDIGGVRIRPPRSPSAPQHHERSQSRDVTLLENGMIVEHVDVRKEEREARERLRKEERRARKSSRNSYIDASSIMSTQSLGGDTGLTPYSRYSQVNPSRPMSVLTAGDYPRAQSQLSFSDVNSLTSGSPRRSVFFPARLWKDGFRSQDSLAPSGMSGSMIDMHVALQREANHPYVQSPVDLNTPRRSQIWPPTELVPTESRQSRYSEKSKKKRKGLAKIWRIVTRSSKNDKSPTETISQDTDDDLPLAPPPPLSYLVNRGAPGEGGRHASTPSLQSMTSPMMTMSSSGMSPPTAPSSIHLSSAVPRPSGPDLDIPTERKSGGNYYDEPEMQQPVGDGNGRSQASGFKNIHSVISEPDMRQRHSMLLQNAPPVPVLPNVTNLAQSQSTSNVIQREKSLPPLPGDGQARPFPGAEPRPRTMYTFDPSSRPPGSGPAHDFLPPQAPFRTQDNRRRSFGGLMSRPNLSGIPNQIKELPVSFGSRYDEFGISRRSLNLLNLNTVAVTPSQKRKSRFSFASLLGKKQHPERDLLRDNVAQQFPTMRNSGSDAHDEIQTNGYATSGYATSHSRHSALSPTPGARMSVTSRKALDELVAQDPEFIAYRYPSGDQQLDLLR